MAKSTVKVETKEVKKSRPKSTKVFRKGKTQKVKGRTCLTKVVRIGGKKFALHFYPEVVIEKPKTPILEVKKV
jgi:hypothetical protein